MFIEQRFPDDLSYGSSGGPQYSTTIAVARSGVESRNANWSIPRRKFNAAYNVRTLEQLDTLLTWFHTCRGRAYGFRYKDWSDYKSGSLRGSPSAVDQIIGVGNGVLTAFQLIKTYAVSGHSQSIKIVKPVQGTVQVSIDNITKTEGVDYTVNYATGIITFGVSPAPTAVIKSGYEYDVPVRFDVDDLSDIQAVNFNVFASHVPLLETRDIT